MRPRAKARTKQSTRGGEPCTRQVENTDTDATESFTSRGHARTKQTARRGFARRNASMGSNSMQRTLRVLTRENIRDSAVVDLPVCIRMLRDWIADGDSVCKENDAFIRETFSAELEKFQREGKSVGEGRR